MYEVDTVIKKIVICNMQSRQFISFTIEVYLERGKEKLKQNV